MTKNRQARGHDQDARSMGIISWRSAALGKENGRFAYVGQDPGRRIVPIIIIIFIKYRRKVISSVLLLKYPDSNITLQSYLCCVNM